MKAYPIILENDYQTIASWWEDYSWPIVPKEILPQNGFMVKSEEVPLVAGFCYKTDSPILIFEWIVGNPKVEKSLRKEGLKYLINYVTLWSKSQGFSKIITMTKNSGMVESLKDCKFQETDKEMIHFMRSI